MEYWVARCEFNSTQLEDIRLIYSMYYNKLEYIRFDSAVERYVGYTAYGVKHAERFNNGPELARRKGERERYCLPNVGIDYDSALT